MLMFELSYLSVISDRSREIDGGEMAGERLCQWLKADSSPWKAMPFLLFRSPDDDTKIQLRKNKGKGVFKTQDQAVVLQFVQGNFGKRK
jgi:hypothetical protein